MAKKRKEVPVSEVQDDDGNSEPDEDTENRRGPTVVAEVGKAIQKGIKISLEWNHNRVPTGVNRITFANYIGVVARERVSINFREWDDVPETVKKEVYEHITKGFVVPLERKSYVLGRASISWRTFKARLRKNWMYDSNGEDKNVIIRTPPGIYPWILQSDWDKFIATYTDPKFKELSDLNRERVKKRTSSYRGGRKGYLYYEEEIVKELISKNIPVGEVPRHLVWIRAHSKNVNGVIYFDNPADFEVAQAIKELEAQQIKGEIDVSGRNDLLGRALKTPEHGGSVRGVGSGVTNKQYFGFNKPVASNQLRSELYYVKSELANMKNNHNLLLSYLMSGEFNSLNLKQLIDNSLKGTNDDGYDGRCGYVSSSGESTRIPNLFNQGIQDVQFQLKDPLVGKKEAGFLATRRKADQYSDYVEETNVEQQHVPEKQMTYVPTMMTATEQVGLNHLFPQGVDSMCSLAIEKDDWLDVVAHGHVYVPRDGQVVNHHFKPVPADHYRVSIKEEVNSNALLPCPEGEIRYVCQGKDNFLLWPVHLVIPRNKVLQANEQPAKEITTSPARSPSSQSSSTRRYMITAEDKLKLTSNLVKVFKDVAIGMKKNGKTKSFTVPAKLFQNEHTVILDFEDMLDWCFQKEIGSSHMSILMMYLGEMVHTEGISGLFGFCDSNILSPETPTRKNEDDRCDYLSRVFACNDAKNKNQLFFAPYNEGHHWMLAVICPWVGLVHWLDPAGVENEPREFAKTIINKAIIKFSTEYRKDISKIKKNPYIRWKKIECPRQPLGSNDCGYYVGRYMVEIIESRQLFVPEKYFDKTPSTYTQQMIDELREAWISYVTGYHQPENDDDLLEH